MRKFNVDRFKKTLVKLSEQNLEKIENGERQVIDEVIRREGDEPNERTRGYIKKSRRRTDLSYHLSYKGRKLGKVKIKTIKGIYIVTFDYIR